MLYARPASLACLDTERVGLGRAELAVLAERRHGAGLLEPDIGVELVGQHGVEVVADALRVRPVDDPDCTLEARAGECLAQFGPRLRAPFGQRARDARVPEKALVAVGPGRDDVLDPHR